MTIDNATVLVTGANRGIGKACAQGFGKRAKKVYLAVRNPDSVRDMVESDPAKFIPLKLDVTNQSDIDAAAQAAQDVDILINNAGVLHMSATGAQGLIESGQDEMNVNYFGPARMIHAFAPILKSNGGGTIVTVASIASFLSFPGIPSYCASKAATHSLIMAARMELADQGTKVIGVYPGPIDTDMARDIAMDKAPPSQVAEETIRAIESGAEEVFPDDMSREFYETFRRDPKEVERQMLEMYREAQAAREKAA